MMKRTLPLILSLLFFPAALSAGLNFGLVKAVRKKVDRLDSKVDARTASAPAAAAPTPSGTRVWTREYGSGAQETVRYSGADSSGNIYVTGSTAGSLGGANAGSDDMFLVKYDSSGNRQWTRQLGTASSDVGFGVAVDTSANVYVGGSTSGALDGQASAGGSDIFLTKYSSDGTKQWTRQIGTAGADSGYQVAVDSTGAVYVSGTTLGSLDGQASSGSMDVVIVKYAPDGTKQWTRQRGTAGSDMTQAIAADASGNIYLGATVATGLDGNAGSGGDDIALLKYDTAGNWQWTRQLGTALTDSPMDVSVAPSGDIYVAGITMGALDGNVYAGGIDIFLVKYSAAGAKQWTKQLGTASHDWGMGVTALASAVYVSGYTVGGSLDGNTSAGLTDLFLTKYGTDGTRIWTRQHGTTANDQGSGCTADPSGNIYVAGHTNGNMDGNTTAGGNDLFLVKYTP